MRIAICTPVYRTTEIDFTVSLARMLLAANKLPISLNGQPDSLELDLFVISGSLITYNRTLLVREALAWGAGYILWADADHVFPPDSLLRLLAHDRPVVGVNYPRRGEPHLPTARDLDGKLVRTTEDLAGQRVLQEVESMGFGLCLMKMETLHGLAEPLFETSQDVGEDVSFFRKLRENGARLFIDHALSWEVGHIGSRTIMNAEAGEAPDAQPAFPAAGPR
jgi:hypothetical protein